MKILVVEDDPEIASLIARGLKDNHFDVDMAANGYDGFEMAQTNLYNVVLLDVMLPVLTGWEVCERLREEGNDVAILMLTARDSIDDRVRGLNIGSDDYLPKPFAFPELLARIRALVRRDRKRKSQTIRVADLTIDISARRVSRAGKEVGLSQREFDLLEALAGNAGMVLSRETIQDRVWMDQDSYSNTVDVYINLLRKKIDAGHDIKLIHTVRGTGYTLRQPELGTTE